MSVKVRKRTFFGHVRPAKIQISLHIHADWSESSFGVFWVAKNTTHTLWIRTHTLANSVDPDKTPHSRGVWSESTLFATHADKEDSDHTTRKRTLIWVFFWRTYPKIRSLTLGLKQWCTLHAWAFGTYMYLSLQDSLRFLSLRKSTDKNSLKSI